MPRQTFVVTLQTLSPFEEYFPGLTPARMAEIVRNAVQNGIGGAPVPLPFEVTVEGTQEIASASGQMRAAYPRDAFEEAEQATMWGK